MGMGTGLNAGTGAGVGTRAGAATATARPAVRERADAARNRERIVAAAGDVFLAHGPDAPLDEIARRAGVGNATLYRHFPDRAALVRDVVLAVTTRIAAHAETALASVRGRPAAAAAAGAPGTAAGEERTDAFTALRRFVSAAVDEHVGALCALLLDRCLDDDPALPRARERIRTLVAELLDEGKRSQHVRADIEVGDVLVALSQLTRPLPGTGCAETARFRDRHVQLYLDGLRAPARSTLPWHAATLEELRRSQPDPARKGGCRARSARTTEA